jgi:hypothetical protein
MIRNMKVLTCLLLLLYSFFCHAQEDTVKRHARQSRYFSVYINGSMQLVVTRSADGKELISENLGEFDAAAYIDDTTYGRPYYIRDLNFDGYDDISFPSNSGNVQRFEQVYLFDPIQKILVLNGELSEIACPDADPIKKTLTGACFHSSAAENWTETYKWIKGKLILVEKEGTLPCPPDENCYYLYKQKRIKGKMVFIYKKRQND